MTIYVDEFPPGWGRWTGGGHMLTTDLDELHEMARKINLRPEWFQDKNFPHYDVVKTKRIRAIRYGAVEIEIGEIPDDVLMRLPSGGYETWSERKRQQRL